MSETRIESRPKIDRNRVIMVYTGKQGCMCGCKGKYHYPKAMQAEGGKRRGYAVSDDEVNERVVTRIINRISASESVEVQDTVFGEVVYLVDNNDTNGRIAVYAKRDS